MSPGHSACKLCLLQSSCAHYGWSNAMHSFHQSPHRSYVAHGRYDMHFDTKYAHFKLIERMAVRAGLVASVQQDDDDNVEEEHVIDDGMH